MGPASRRLVIPAVLLVSAIAITVLLAASYTGAQVSLYDSGDETSGTSENTAAAPDSASSSGSTDSSDYTTAPPASDAYPAESGDSGSTDAAGGASGADYSASLRELYQIREGYLYKVQALEQYMAYLNESMRKVAGDPGGIEYARLMEAYRNAESMRNSYLSEMEKIDAYIREMDNAFSAAAANQTDYNASAVGDAAVQANDTQGQAPPASTVNASAVNQTQPPGQTSASSADNATADYSHVPTAAEVRDAVKNFTDSYESGMKDYAEMGVTAEDRFVLTQAEWRRQDNTTSMRGASMQQYETPVLLVNATPGSLRLTIQSIGENNAMRLNISGQIDDAVVAGSVPETAPVRDVAVTSIDIAVKREVRNAELNVVRLQSMPQAVAQRPSGKVFQYVEIEKRAMADEDISDVGIGFRVPLSWLRQENVTDRSLIALHRHAAGNWTELPTRWLGEDDANAYYESLSPGLSFFVISITAAAASPVQIELPSDAAGPEDDIARIKFDWMFVLFVAVGLLIIAALRFTPLSKRLSGTLKREKPEDLQRRLAELRADREEALNRYYKREITEQQMTAIVNEKKKQEFDMEMRLRRLHEKKAGRVMQEKPRVQPEGTAAGSRA